MCQMLIRTFISIDVPITDEISSLLQSLRAIKGIKVPPEGQIHLTLKFLGDTDDKKVKKLCTSLWEALFDSPPFDIIIEGIGAFPNERNPRILWMGVKAPDELINIAEIVDDNVKSLNLRCDDKRFSPHITVGRVNGSADIRDLVRDCKGKVLCTFRCDRVNVMESILYPKGAVHSLIESIPLD